MIPQEIRESQFPSLGNITNEKFYEGYKNLRDLYFFKNFVYMLTLYFIVFISYQV